MCISSLKRVLLLVLQLSFPKNFPHFRAILRPPETAPPCSAGSAGPIVTPLVMDLGKILRHRVYKPYTLCPMCYGYIGSPKAGVYICSHEGAKRPREGWYILPLLVTQCFHSNEGRAVYGLYTRCLNILPRSITLRMFDHVHKLIDQQQPLVNWPFQCSTTVNQLC